MTTLTDILRQNAKMMYPTAENLVRMVDAGALDWKPATGRNWMTTGQLIDHLTSACGAGIKGFVTGDWGLPPGVKFEDMDPNDALPPAEKMSSCGVEEALTRLAKDRDVALHFIAEAGESNLLSKRLTAPWGGPEMTLYQQLDTCIHHLGQHKGQLFYYLKLQGKEVHTGHLWGM